GSWSSDGRLAFAGIGTDHWQQHTVQTWRTGEAATRPLFTPVERRIGSLAWSPRVRQLAYSVARPDGHNGELWVVDADGGNAHLLLAHGSWPAWSTAAIDVTALPPLVVPRTPSPSSSPKTTRPSARPTPRPTPTPVTLPAGWTAGAAAPQWSPSPSGTRADLTSLDVLGSAGWAVGAAGTLVTTSDGGATWHSQPTGYDGWLAGVAFGDAGHGWAVSAQGAITASSDGGASWSGQDAPGSGPLTAVAAVDATHAWAVGGTEDAQGMILATTDGGAWHEQNAGDGERLLAVAFFDRDHGWACGFEGTLLATTDGGAGWQAQGSSATAGDATLTSVSCPAAGVCLVAGFTGSGSSSRALLLATTDGGADWSRRSVGDRGTTIRSIAFSDATHGWAAASFGTRGVLLSTSDGGRTWRARSWGPRLLNAVDCTPSGAAWGAGDGGLLVTAP
ncbi:MAG TPA: YCF48-related protein, partial [Thermoleophilia bacterium]|nr:YCF48-related protein [Thermoleophilia bacterium]